MNRTLLARYKRQIAVYRNRTSAQLVAAWARLEGIDEPHVSTFEEATAVPLAAAKVSAVALSAAVFALDLGIRPVGVIADDIDVTPDTRGPFHAAWHALSVGRPYEEALLVGSSTASAVGYDFVQRTARRTGDHVAERSRQRVTWQRVPGGNACEWCLERAGGDYPTSEAADYGHERCDCDVIPN